MCFPLPILILPPQQILQTSTHITPCCWLVQELKIAACEKCVWVEVVDVQGDAVLTVRDVVTSWWRSRIGAHLRLSTCRLWSLHLIIICLLEYVQEASPQGETQWKTVSEAFLGRFSGLIENHHSCVPALKVTGSALAVPRPELNF